MQEPQQAQQQPTREQVDKQRQKHSTTSPAILVIATSITAMIRGMMTRKICDGCHHQRHRHLHQDRQTMYHSYDNDLERGTPQALASASRHDLSKRRRRPHDKHTFYCHGPQT